MGDFLLDDNFDLIISQGDFMVGDTEETDIELLLYCSPGQNRLYPESGIGLFKYLNSVYDYTVETKIKKLLEQNGIFRDVILDKNNNNNINIQII